MTWRSVLARLKRSRTRRAYASRRDSPVPESSERPEQAGPEPVDPLIALRRFAAGEAAQAPGGGDDQVARLEERYGIRLPEDFRLYLSTGAPASDAFDDALTLWWAPGRVCSIPDDYKSPVNDPAIAAEAGAYLLFADYMIWCWAWAVCCSEGPNRGRVALIAGSPDGFVADSFAEFVERYLRDPEAMAHVRPPMWRETGPSLH